MAPEKTRQNKEKNSQKVTSDIQKNMNQVKKQKNNKKYYVNKIININYNQKNKKDSSKRKNSFFQTDSKKFKEAPRIHEIFNNFTQALETNKLFKNLDYFTYDQPNFSKEVAFDKQTSLQKQFGSFFSDKDSFKSILAYNTVSFELHIWRLYLSSRKGVVASGEVILNWPETISFIENYFTPDS